MNIVELEAWRKKEDNRDRELLEAFFAGAENSVHAKDPNRPGEKGTLARFMMHCCDKDPVSYMKMLINKLTPIDE
jgi:hypothetical protein